MVLLEKIPLTNRSRNAEHDYLFDKLVNSIPLAFATTHNFLSYHNKMTSALAQEHLSYKRMTKSVDTATLIVKDNNRKKCYRRLKLTIEAASLDVDTEMSAAGNNCLIPFGTTNLANLPYTEATAAYRDLIDKLESEKYTMDIEKIGAMQALADLEEANNDFDETYSGRAAERYTRDTAILSTKDARLAMEKAYYDVMHILNALYIQSTILAPDEELAAELQEIGDEINAHINQFTINLVRRGVGTISSVTGNDDENEDEGDGPTDPTEPTDPEQPEPTDPTEPGEGGGSPGEV